MMFILILAAILAIVFLAKGGSKPCEDTIEDDTEDDEE